MAWPNPFRRRDENTRTIWGYTFQLTDDHLTPEQTAPLKQSFDRLGDEALARLNALSPMTALAVSRDTPEKTKGLVGEEQSKNIPTQKPVVAAKRDLYQSLRDNAPRDPILTQLWTEAHTVPSWVDWDSVARGQDVFYR